MKDWTALACHIYDPMYNKVMTIAVSNMQLECSKTQEQMLVSLIGIIKKHRCEFVDFKGFMADSAHANFNAI